jgi:hypothetical protein
LKCQAWVVSIPTAPTIYLSDGWILNKNTRGKKGQIRPMDPVLCFFAAARVTTGVPVHKSATNPFSALPRKRFFDRHKEGWNAMVMAVVLLESSITSSM